MTRTKRTRKPKSKNVAGPTPSNKVSKIPKQPTKKRPALTWRRTEQPGDKTRGNATTTPDHKASNFQAHLGDGMFVNLRVVEDDDGSSKHEANKAEADMKKIERICYANQSRLTDLEKNFRAKVLENERLGAEVAILKAKNEEEQMNVDIKMEEATRVEENQRSWTHVFFQGFMFLMDVEELWS